MFTTEKLRRLRHEASSLEGPSQDLRPRSDRVYSARPWSAHERSPLELSEQFSDGPPSEVVRLPGDARGSIASLSEIPDEVIIDSNPGSGRDSAARHVFGNNPSTSNGTYETDGGLRKLLNRFVSGPSIETVETIETISDEMVPPNNGSQQNYFSNGGSAENTEIVTTAPEVSYFKKTH